MPFVDKPSFRVWSESDECQAISADRRDSGARRRVESGRAPPHHIVTVTI